MKKSILILLLFIISKSTSMYGENTNNYAYYHKYINKAEYYFYLQNNVDSCLHYYNLAFDGFSFNHIHDLINAAQIACFSAKEYKSYLYKGYSYGLQVKHLKQIPLFKSDCIEEFENFEKTSSYQEIRKNYLKSISIDYLDWMYQFAIEEQIAKETLKESDFALWWDEHIEELTSKINQYGFPSNQIIGIECSTIFEELGIQNKDMSERVLKHKDKDILCYENMPDFFVFGEDTVWFEKDSNSTMCFDVDETILGVSLIMVCLIHYGQLYTSNDTIYNRLFPIWLQEIEKGNLHPRQMAIFHDNMHRMYVKDEDLTSNTILFEWLQRGVGEVFGIETQQIHLIFYDESFNINEFREKHNIVSLEVDAKKKEYEEKQDFKLFWGFSRCQ